MLRIPVQRCAQILHIAHRSKENKVVFASIFFFDDLCQFFVWPYMAHREAVKIRVNRAGNQI